MKCDLDAEQEIRQGCKLEFICKSPEDNVSFYVASKKELKNKLAAVIKDGTRLSKLVDFVHAEVVDLRKNHSKECH